jgi:hypothetical protein
MDAVLLAGLRTPRSVADRQCHFVAEFREKPRDDRGFAHRRGACEHQWGREHEFLCTFELVRRALGLVLQRKDAIGARQLPLHVCNVGHALLQFAARNVQVFMCLLGAALCQRREMERSGKGRGFGCLRAGEAAEGKECAQERPTISREHSYDASHAATSRLHRTTPSLRLDLRSQELAGGPRFFASAAAPAPAASSPDPEHAHARLFRMSSHKISALQFQSYRERRRSRTRPVPAQHTPAFARSSVFYERLRGSQMRQHPTAQAHGGRDGART